MNINWFISTWTVALHILHKGIHRSYQTKDRLPIPLYRPGYVVRLYVYRQAPGAANNTFQDLPRLRETADNTEPYT
jgi:hypothetical protein